MNDIPYTSMPLSEPRPLAWLLPADKRKICFKMLYMGMKIKHLPLTDLGKELRKRKWKEIH